MTVLPKTEPLGGQPLVVCAICETVVDQGSATKRTVETPKGVVSVWVCKTCNHLGSEEQTKKYIMKEQKTVGG
jgi:predicted metal-binding protein